jgi:hypothetical protein
LQKKEKMTTNPPASPKVKDCLRPKTSNKTTSKVLPGCVSFEQFKEKLLKSVAEYYE